MIPEENIPCGTLQFELAAGTLIAGDSCTDIRGERTGQFVRVHPVNSSVVELIDERHGTSAFVHAGSVRPLAVAAPKEEQ